MQIPNFPRFFVICGQFYLAAGALWSAHGNQSGGGSSVAAEGFTVDVSDRLAVLAFHHEVYHASEGSAARMAWNGNVSMGNAGTTSPAFKEDVRRRVNYYRALVGLPADVAFNALKSAKCQQAALIFSANHAISHTPGPSWAFYTADGRQAAELSSISLGAYGPAAVDGYMRETGAGNHVVGHRRWLLTHYANEMGTGDIPPSGGYPSGGYNSSNSLWVIGDFKPASALKFVAWPNEGYTPSPLLPARWSLSYPGADFSTAAVSMTLNGANVPLTVISRTDNGYGDNTVVWEPASLPASVTADLPYQVTVTGIKGPGVPTSKTYAVKVFNPDILGQEIAISGTATPPATGAFYYYNPIPRAEAYGLEVTALTPASWLEGAEDLPAPRVTAAITPGYSLRQTAVVRTGTKAFQLAFPSGSFADQSMQLDREFVTSSSSLLLYHERAGYSYASNTFETQISTNDGRTWTTIASRNGVNTAIDGTWRSRSISLAAYAGQTVKLRFILKSNASGVYPGTSSSHGFFIDDISVTAASEPLAQRTTLAAGITHFALNEAAAGRPLAVGASYQLRVRPMLGGRWFSYGAPKWVTLSAAEPPSYANWAMAREIAAGLAPGTLADPHGDPDQDGRGNLMEYAFGGSPTNPADDPSRLPQSRVEGASLVLSYRRDLALGDVSITPEACAGGMVWKPPGASGAPAGFTDQLISTEGQLQTREARQPLSAGRACFLRLRITRH